LFNFGQFSEKSAGRVLALVGAGSVAKNGWFVVKTDRLPRPSQYQESAVAESDQFKWRHYQGEIILLCVRWYLRYALSYRDLEEMMRERGLSLDHTTIYRWVQAYAPELEKRALLQKIF
jgi:hypothetical protein